MLADSGPATPSIAPWPEPGGVLGHPFLHAVGEEGGQHRAPAREDAQKKSRSPSREGKVPICFAAIQVWTGTGCGSLFYTPPASRGARCCREPPPHRRGRWRPGQCRFRRRDRVMPKVMRGLEVMGSSPMSRMRPRQAIMMDLSMEPCERYVTKVRPSTMSEKYSCGPNLSANLRGAPQSTRGPQAPGFRQ